MFRLPPQRILTLQPEGTGKYGVRDSKSSETQVGTLIYCMRTEAKQIYKLLSFKKMEDKKNFDVIINKFDAYLILKKMSSMSVLDFT